MSPLNRIVTTYYVRNPQGNVLAVYEHKHGDSDNGTFTLAEQHLYGAGRLGMRKRDLALNATNTSETPATYYELTNHLGNVMAVISDKASDTNEPTVVSLSDYYPFGMTEPGRSWNPGDYRFGYTGHEKESDLAEGVYITEYRLLDTRLGRWMSVDPRWMEEAYLTPYHYCRNIPLWFLDEKGDVETKEKGREKTVWFEPSTGKEAKTLRSDIGQCEINGYQFNGIYTLEKGTIHAVYLDENGEKQKKDITAYRLVHVELSSATPTDPDSGKEPILYTKKNVDKDDENLVIYDLRNKINNPKYQEIIDRLKSNCHGLAYALGQVWIMDEDAKPLIDAEYFENTDGIAKEGDVVVYYGAKEAGKTVPLHSLTVKSTSGGKITSWQDKLRDGKINKEVRNAPDNRAGGYEKKYYRKKTSQ